MGPEVSAIVICVLVTAAVGALGSFLLARLSRNRPAVAAIGAPLVVVAALAAGIATASGAMLIAEAEQHTLIVVLLSGMPVAVGVGLVLARRVSRMERDVARDRAARARDLQIEASRRETIRWLSHDLRTPLAGIRALAETIEDGAHVDPGPVGTRIVEQADRIDAMVDDIAELSRLHTPTEVRREPVMLDDLVSDAATGIAPLAEAAGVSVVGEEFAGVLVVGDARSLGRAVSNVLRNAVQHTPSGGQVAVATRRYGTDVAVEVSDGCGGVPPEHLVRMFEAGWRGDPSRHTRGMGLGLAITQEVARAHEGQASAVNLPDGTGCVVRVLVPGEHTSTPA